MSESVKMNQAAEVIKEMMGEVGVLLIGGGSGSGKTTLAAELVKAWGEEKAVMLSIDNYYRPASEFADLSKRNCDDPVSVDLAMMSRDLERLMAGENIMAPIFKFATVERIGEKEIVARPIIIVEGIFALNEQLVNLGKVKVYVDCPVDKQVERRAERDLVRMGESKEQTREFCEQVVLPMQKIHVEPTRARADIIVDNSSELA